MAQQNKQPQPGDGDAGGQLLSVISLASQPDLTASRLETKDTSDGASDRQIDIIRFVGELTPQLFGQDLYLEGGIGVARSTFDLALENKPADDVEFSTIAAIGGIGPSFELADFTFLRPQVLLGFGYVDESFGIPIVDDDGPVDDSADLRLWSFAAGLALSLDYEAPFGDDIIDARLRASQLFLNTIWSADDSLGANASNQTINGTLVYKLNTGWQPYDMPFYLTGLVAGNAFLGDQSDALGFDHYFEYGAGIEFDTRAQDWWVKSFRLRGAGIIGDGVTGFAIGGGIGFQ